MKICYCLLVILFLSCNLSDNKKPATPYEDPNRKMGFAGHVIEYNTNKNIEGCTVKFWGESIKDTVVGFTDTSGYFKVYKYYKWATGIFNLKITDKKYGIIVNKTITLYNGCLDDHFYFAYAPCWLKLNLITLSKWNSNDNFELSWDNSGFTKYGLKINQFDTFFIMKTKFDGAPKKIFLIYNKDSAYEIPTFLYMEPWDTTENILIF